MRLKAIDALFLAIIALAGDCSAERDNKYDPKSSNYQTVMVSFDSQGGSAVAAQTTGYNRCAEAPAEPIRTGYTFGGWYRDSSYTEKWHFPTNRVDNDITLYARWLANPCTVIYDSQGGSGVGPETVEYGDLLAVPSDPVLTGYTFDAWYREPSCITPWVFASDTMAGDMFLYAGWVINTYTLTYTAGSNGSISGTTSQVVNYNTSGSAVTAAPNTGYHFYQWSDGSTANPRTDSSVSADISVSAMFAINTYTLTYTAGANGSISGSTPQMVNYGSSGSAVTAVANTGYHFVQWSDGLTSNPRTDSGVSAAISVSASFAINTYTLTYTAGSNGTISGTTPQNVNHGSNGTAVTAVPNTGYHFDQWSDGSTTNPRTDSSVSANITVFASFAINTYTLTYTAGANGSISGSTTQVVNHGSNGSAVTALANANYHFVQWSDGVLTATRTDSSVSADKSVSAMFAINTYTLTYTAGSNGSISGSTTQVVNHGSNGSAVTAAPNAGYHFVQWSDGSTVNPRTETNVTADMAVNATFAISGWVLGGSAEDQAYSIQQTDDGGYIVAGSTQSNDGDVTGNHGSSDYWIVKLDASGNIQWQRCLGGSSYDYAISIRQTADGGYIVAGYTGSNDGNVTGNHGISDFWVVKLDAAGAIQWQSCLGGSSSEYANSIQQTADGGYILTGYTGSNNGDVTGNHGGTDYWVVKLDASGAIQWQICLGGSSSDDARSIQQTADGGYIVAGYTNSNNGDVTGNHGNSDYWIVKLDASGNIQWQKCLGGSNNDSAFSMQQTADGGYIVAGFTQSNDGDVTGYHGSNDGWIVKLDASGNIQWQRCLGGSGNDTPYSIRQTADGGYIVAGFTYSNDGDVAGNHGGADCWIVKLDASGNIQWQRCLGGSGYDYAYSIQQTADGGYIVAGYTNSNNGDVTGNHGNSDYWIVKLDANGNFQ